MLNRLALIIALLAPLPAQAEMLNGLELYAFCQATPGAASAYVMGVIDMRTLILAVSARNVDPSHMSANEDAMISATGKACPPNPVNGIQLGEITCQYLAKNPAKRSATGSVVVLEAMVEAFPYK